jgi:glycosyltransferase involved in cell wall biosynthesis
MSKNPKLAVVIPCYNYAAFVERAIRSVLDQARDDCELVVVDDGSTDRSWDVINHTGVTAFRTRNQGARLACLFGLEKTSAPFILFLDADDELKSGALRAIIDELDSGVAKLQFSLTRIDAAGNLIGRAAPSLETFREHDKLVREILKSCTCKSPPTSGNVFRRDLCELLREADYDNFIDGVMLFAAPFFGDVVSLSDELGCYRIHGRNDSGLGLIPDAAGFARDRDRFLARVEHLRAILGRFGLDRELADPRDTFYFRQQQFHFDIMSGKRPRIGELAKLWVKIFGGSESPKEKLAFAAYFALCGVLPALASKALIAYRHGTGQRTAFGFVKQVLGPRGPLRDAPKRSAY